MNQINVACNGCDYFDRCHKVIVAGEERMLAKEQDLIPVSCQSVVQDICRDCYWYQERKCASWKTLNGKTQRHTLAVCPKKVRVPMTGRVKV